MEARDPEHFTPGLVLIYTDTYVINRPIDGVRQPGNYEMPMENLQIRVPEETEFVYLAVVRSEVRFGNCTNERPGPIGRLMHTVENITRIGPGLFTFDFRAILEGADPAALWCGEYHIEMLCFGKLPKKLLDLAT